MGLSLYKRVWLSMPLDNTMDNERVCKSQDSHNKNF